MTLGFIDFAPSLDTYCDGLLSASLEEQIERDDLSYGYPHYDFADDADADLDEDDDDDFDDDFDDDEDDFDDEDDEEEEDDDPFIDSLPI